MARIAQWGFELNSSTQEGTSFGTTSISTTTVNGGTYSLRANPSSSTGWRVYAISGISGRKIWIRFYLNIATAPGGTVGIFTVGAAKTDVLGIRLTSGSALQLYNYEDATQIGSDSSALSANTWHCIEFYMDTTTLSATDVSARINQNTEFATGTANLVTSITTLEIGPGSDGVSSTCDLFFDDIAINNDSGIQSIFYFDSSDAAVSDPDNVWTNEANAFDDDRTTSATTTTTGTVSTNFILAEGTNAPTSGTGTITQVRGRIIGSYSSISPAVGRIYSDGLAENLNTTNTMIPTAKSGTVGDWDVLDTPSGGWTWAKVAALEFKGWLDTTGTYTLTRVEIEVTHSGVQDSWPGRGMIVHLYPNAAGDLAEWTRGGTDSGANWSQVEEFPSDDASTYVRTTTVDNRDLYNFDATPSSIVSSSVINTVCVGGRTRADVATNVPSFRYLLQPSSTGTLQQGVSITPNSTSWRTLNDESNGEYRYTLVSYRIPGNGNTSWTKTDLDGLQAGLMLYVDNTNNIDVSTIWVSVDFSEQVSTDLLMQFPERRGLKIRG